MDNNNDQLEQADNKFYAPELAEHLVIRWMGFVKLWSALGLDLLDPEISRVSNNHAEAQFRVTKTLTFKGIANSSLADRIRELELERDATLARVQLNINLKGTRGEKSKYPETNYNKSAGKSRDTDNKEKNKRNQ